MEEVLARIASEPTAVTLRVPASLKLTVPLSLLGFAATLSAVNFLYHLPRAERAAEEESRKRLAQEMRRLQSTLEYLQGGSHQPCQARRPAG
jgi:hypothetical protein